MTPRTDEEFREFIDEGLRIRLPGQVGHRNHPKSVERLRFYIVTAGAIVGALAAIWIFSGCQTIANYDAESYRQITGAEAEVIHLMQKASTSSYVSNAAEIERVFILVNKAYQFDANRPLDSVNIAMWKLLRDPNKNTYAGFLREWGKRGTLPQGYVDQMTIVVQYAFSRLAQLEAGKIH